MEAYTISYVLNGVFHEGTPPDFNKLVEQKTSVWKQSDHDKQRREHKADLIQPYKRDGSVNPEFLEVYELEAKETYKLLPSDDELRMKG